MNRFAIIVAGGSGTRMKSALPKQFLSILGKPILLHTLEAFHHADNDLKIILVLNPQFINYWKSLKPEFPNLYALVEGGKSRFHSVRNGLSVIDETADLIAIHDAVRPIVSQQLIKRTFEATEQHKAVIPAVPLKDSIRQLDGQQSQAVPRAQFRLIQTPQCFQYTIIKEAYLQEYNSLFTDSASVVEAMGIPVHLIEGESTNIKITTPEDLLWAEVFLNNNKTAQ